MMNDELRHHGILGMKWGVRKSSYHSSSGKMMSRKERKKRAQALEKARATRQSKKEYENAKAYALKKGNASDVLRFKGDLTNQQLNDAVNRISMEQRLSQLQTSQPKKVSKGKQYVSRLVGGAVNQSMQNITNQLVDAGMTYVVNELAIPAVGLGEEYKVQRKYSQGNKKKKDDD